MDLYNAYGGMDRKRLGYYITAYGIAVKHGFHGSEEEWLASLKGERGAAMEMRYDGEKDELQWRLVGAEEWTGVLPLAVIRGRAFDEAVQEVRESKEAAAVSAREAYENKSAAEEARAVAEAAEVRAEGFKNQAEQTLEQTRILKEQAEAAKQEAEVSRSAAEESKNQASVAKEAATERAAAAEGSAALATEKAIEAKSWAIGGTGTREGENTHNAKYYAEIAGQAAGGGVTSFNGRSGAIIPQKEDYSGLFAEDFTAIRQEMESRPTSIFIADEAFINMLIGNTGRVGQDYLFGSKGDDNGTISETLNFTLFQALNNCVQYSGYTIVVANASGEEFPLTASYFKSQAFYLATLIENKKVILRVLTIPVEIIHSLTDSSEDKALSAAMGKALNETKLTDKKRSLSVQELNNANYPTPYVCSTDKGKQLGLPTDWAFIQYFRHENNDGFGTQVAYKLDRANQEGDNSKLWTMKIRVATNMAWGAWENVATSIPKGHYPVADLNTCEEDGKHYYFNGSTLNKPLAHGDGIVSVYAYNVGSNDQQSINPCVVQVSYSWWQETIFMRRGIHSTFTEWKELLSSNNSVFSVTPNSIHMNGGDKRVEVRHIDGISTHGMDGNLYFNYHNNRPVFFKAYDGSDHTLQELFQSASNGKTLLANAITGKGIPTSTTASWQEMAGNIGQIQRLTVLRSSTALPKEFLQTAETEYDWSIVWGSSTTHKYFHSYTFLSPVTNLRLKFFITTAVYLGNGEWLDYGSDLPVIVLQTSDGKRTSASMRLSEGRYEDGGLSKRYYFNEDLASKVPINWNTRDIKKVYIAYTKNSDIALIEILAW